MKGETYDFQSKLTSPAHTRERPAPPCTPLIVNRSRSALLPIFVSSTSSRQLVCASLKICYCLSPSEPTKPTCPGLARPSILGTLRCLPHGTPATSCCRSRAASVANSAHLPSGRAAPCPCVIHVLSRPALISARPLFRSTAGSWYNGAHLPRRVSYCPPISPDI